MNCRIKKRAFIAYIVCWIALSLYGLSAQVEQGYPTVLGIMSAVLVLISASGLIGYALQFRLFSPNAWRNLFYFHTGTLLLLSVMFIDGVRLLEVIVYLVTWLLNAPLLFGLYRYSEPNNEIWRMREEQALLEQLMGALSIHGHLIANHTTGNKNIKVDLIMEQESYVVRMKYFADTNQSFKNEFASLESAIKFIEKYASIGPKQLLSANG
ncbi:hypothetical protein [Vibrio sp. WXL210]|uniref:hypothetical protein n=1 Tax=Vibrio sp. WXL210 TaxID=3450709 RepID=UPI003EC76777